MHILWQGSIGKFKDFKMEFQFFSLIDIHQESFGIFVVTYRGDKTTGVPLFFGNKLNFHFSKSLSVQLPRFTENHLATCCGNPFLIPHFSFQDQDFLTKMLVLGSFQLESKDTSKEVVEFHPNQLGLNSFSPLAGDFLAIR